MYFQTDTQLRKGIKITPPCPCKRMAQAHDCMIDRWHPPSMGQSGPKGRRFPLIKINRVAYLHNTKVLNHTAKQTLANVTKSAN